MTPGDICWPVCKPCVWGQHDLCLAHTGCECHLCPWLYQPTIPQPREGT